MRYIDFEKVMTTQRMGRYLTACDGNTRKAMTLYRKNLLLSQELFTVIGCFEIALRNKINEHYLTKIGNDWLQFAVASGGMYDNTSCSLTSNAIKDAIKKLSTNYTHSKLVAELGFGFWRYMFAPHQFAGAGKTLLQIFVSKPTSTPAIQYNNSYIFNQLAQVNKIRNRIAHHEPICFIPFQSIKDTQYVRVNYSVILQLFQWMNVDESALLYGLDHIHSVCNDVDAV